MTGENVVGILVDAENLTSLGDGALDALVERAAREGEVVYRRAYGDWAVCGKLAPALTRLGFELVQVHHPAARKNSADIHMTVDAMDLLALDAGLRTFVLATGDSDFAPLFRRLRERRCRVIGAGPRSCLSEAVESSCVDFLYLGTARPRPRVRVVARRPVPPPPAAPALAPPLPVAPPVPEADEAAPGDAIDGAQAWRQLVRVWGWHRVTPEELGQVVAAMRDRGAGTRAEHLAGVVASLGEAWATPFRRVFSVLLKSGLVERVPGEEAAYTVRAVDEELVDRVDTALLGRVRRSMGERGLAWDDVLLDWLAGPSDPERLVRLAAACEGEVAA